MANTFSKLDKILRRVPEDIGVLFEPSGPPETLYCIRIVICAEMALSTVFRDYERETETHRGTRETDS